MSISQSVSGHSREQSTTRYSSQLWGVSDTISKWFKNLQPHGTQISTVTNVPFIQNSNWMTSSVDRNRKFSERTFSAPTIFKATSKLFSSQSYYDDKNCLYFPAFSSRFVDFPIQFCFCCNFSFHEKVRSGQVWEWCDFLYQSKFFCYA